MASFMERKTRDNKIRYTAIVRIKGYPKQSATFPRKTDAKLWAQQIESSIRDGKYFSQAEAKKHTFADLAERYIKTVLGNKSLRAQIIYADQLRKWCSLFGERTLDEINTALISKCRENLANEVTIRGRLRSPATVNRYMAALSSAYSVAVREWQWVDENPVVKLSKLKEAKGRERLLTEDELD